jgi:hypothetical protein
VLCGEHPLVIFFPIPTYTTKCQPKISLHLIQRVPSEHGKGLRRRREKGGRRERERGREVEGRGETERERGRERERTLIFHSGEYVGIFFFSYHHGTFN